MKSISKDEVFNQIEQIGYLADEVLENRELFNLTLEGLTLDIEIEELLLDALNNYEEDIKDKIEVIIDEIISSIDGESRCANNNNMSEDTKCLFIDELKTILDCVIDGDFEDLKVIALDFKDLENRNKRQQRKVNKDEKLKCQSDFIIRRLREGVSIKDIAKELGCSLKTVRRRLKLIEELS